MKPPMNSLPIVPENDVFQPREISHRALQAMSVAVFTILLGISTAASHGINPAHSTVRADSAWGTPAPAPAKLAPAAGSTGA